MFKKIALVLLLSLIGGGLFFIFSAKFSEDKNPLDLEIKTNTGNIVDKYISSDFENINPDNYDSVEEFVKFFNTGSGIELSVDLENETFYTKTKNGNRDVITRFDKDLIGKIDSSSGSSKNLAIVDIFNSYKEFGYVYGEPNGTRFGVRLLEEKELSSDFQLHNSLLLPYSGESFFETLNRLEKKENKTLEDKRQISYLYDFAGDYKKSYILKKISGSEKVKYKISGRIFNLGKTLSGAKIEVLNYDNMYSYTDENGKYELEFDTFSMTRLRFRASYKGLSDGYNGSYVIFDTKEQSLDNLDFILHSYDTKKFIKKDDLIGGKTISVKSSLGNEFIFKNGLVVDINGNVYNGDFNVIIYEFNRKTPGMQNFLSLDNFDDLRGYTGNMMITNGMTYLMLTDTDGKELFISKENPILTKQKVDIDYLLNSSTTGIPKLTEEQLFLLVEKSKQGGYPIDNKFLVERKILGFSPWWVLNRSRGIWENVGIKLFKNGFKEGLYYNID